MANVTNFRTALGFKFLQMGVVEQDFSYADFDTASATVAIDIDGFPIDAFPVAAWVNVRDAFASPSGSAHTLAIGDAGAPTELMAAIDAEATGINSIPGTNAGGFVFESAWLPKLQLAITDDTGDNLTAGSGTAYVLYFRPKPS